MKIRKKEVAVLLAFVLLFGCLCNNPARLRAEEDTEGTQTTETTQPTETEGTKQGKIELIQGGGNLGAGDTLQVQVRIYQMDAFAGMEGMLTYDKTVLEVKADQLVIAQYPETRDAAENWKASVTPYNTTDQDTLKVEWAGENEPEDSDLAAAQNEGLVLTIPFTVKIPIPSENKISLAGIKVFTDKDHSNSIAMDDIVPLTVKLKDLEFQMADVTGDEKIIIPLSITKISDGVTGFTISVSYDKEKLIYDISSHSLGKDANGKVSWQKIETGGDGTLQLKFISTEQLTQKDTGELFNLAFKPRNTVSATETTKVSLKVTAVEYAISDPTPFYLSSADCTVTLSHLEFTLGNVYADSKNEINLVDAVLVLKEIRGLNNPPLTEAQRKAADVDNDGDITLMDVYMIMQYYNGIIKSFPTFPKQ